MKDYRAYSFWLETCGDDLAPQPPLDGSVEVDVAITGAGFTGLWTAYHLLKRAPSLRVAVVEAEIAGFGASGRNGGWCYAGMAVPPAEMTRRYGKESAKATALAMIGAVDDVEAVAAEEGIDADIVRGGAIEIARAGYQVPKVREMAEEYAAIGLGDRVVWLDAAEVKTHLEVPGTLGAAWTKDGLTVQPAKLVRGLARAVEHRGGTIYEQTRVTDYRGGERPAHVTDRGEVRARRAVVLAGEASLARLNKLRRHVIPLTSNIVLTEPLPPEAWAEIGWEGRETVGGFGPTGGYIQRTADGRIAFGPYFARYPFASRIDDALDHDDEVYERARRSLRAWFPQAANCRVTHAWGGVLGAPRDQMPTMGFNPRTKVALAFGYTGEGVAAANLAGRTLADCITETDSLLTRLPMANHDPKPWEPEPLRWAGVNYVRKAYRKLDEEAERTGSYPKRKTMAQMLFDR
ncbi:MAG TPA: FAD-dependent oxidoreductase [Thermomicrobiales bacterium]|nr:FAD-dependent oxidoreductase [Thermomicrobiales bacterium]